MTRSMSEILAQIEARREAEAGGQPTEPDPKAILIRKSRNFGKGNAVALRLNRPKGNASNFLSKNRPKGDGGWVQAKPDRHLQQNRPLSTQIVNKTQNL